MKSQNKILNMEEKNWLLDGVTRSYSTRIDGQFPLELFWHLIKSTDLKYGENPMQPCSVYNPFDIGSLISIDSVRSDGKGKGGESLTNILDINRAMSVLKFFRDDIAVAIMKHNIVSGFAKSISPFQDQTDLFRAARDADLRSNFGGTAVFTTPLTMNTAKSLYELKNENPFFVDVLAAPEFDEGVVSYLESMSANLRINKFTGLEKLPRFIGDETYGLHSIKELEGGAIAIQGPYLTSIKTADDLILRPGVTDKKNSEVVRINRKPTESELEDMLTAWYLNIAGARSNGVVFVKNGVSVAIGSGQVERVGAVEQAIIKGMQKKMDKLGVAYNPLAGTNCFEHDLQNPFLGASCSSDAFFPFRDSIDTLAKVGVRSVIQPYGSIRDAEVITAANEYKMAMPATLERCFGHF